MATYGESLKAAQVGYGDILKGYQDRAAAGISQLDVLGKNQTEDANNYYSSQGKSYDQSAVAHGLGNTTIRNSMQAGNNYQRDRAVGQINNNLNAQKLGIQSQLLGDTLGYQERAGNFGAQYDLDTQRLGLSRDQLAQQASQFGLSLAEQKRQFDNRFAPHSGYGAGMVSPPSRGGGGGGFGALGSGAGSLHPQNSFGGGYGASNSGNYNVPRPGTFVPGSGTGLGDITADEYWNMAGGGGDATYDFDPEMYPGSFGGFGGSGVDYEA